MFAGGEFLQEKKKIKVWMDKLVVSRSIRNNIGIRHEKQYWEVAVCAITVNVSLQLTVREKEDIGDQAFECHMGNMEPLKDFKTVK